METKSHFYWDVDSTIPHDIMIHLYSHPSSIPNPTYQMHTNGCILLMWFVQQKY